MIMPGVLGQWEEGKHECKGQIVKGFGRKMNDSQFHSAVSRKPFHFYLLFFFFWLFFHIIRVWLHFHTMEATDPCDHEREFQAVISDDLGWYGECGIK